jgi:hypothetical protein
MIITFKIPDRSYCLLKLGQKVDFQTPFIEKKTAKDLEIDVANQLRINPKNIFRYLKKLVGDKVEKNEVLAEKKGLLTTIRSYSQQSGIIKEIDHNRGMIIIESTTSEKNKILSPFIGEVEKINKEELHIRLNKAEEFSTKNVDADFGGKTVYFDHSKNYNSLELSEKIIITDKIDSFFQIKAEALGIKGLVTYEKLEEQTELKTAILKNIEDLKKIKKLSFPYCTVISQSAKIYFYQ